MSWARGEDGNGKPIGYAVKAKCEHPGCDADIDRGIAFACGGMHGLLDYGCPGYFCYEHLLYVVIEGDDGNLTCPVDSALCPACHAQATKELEPR